ncbi:MAG: oxalate/formate MFS antiporter [Burkholderiales bacterium]|nr:oxalate/formate MFS antiporter [Burkholderiales bacterium]MDE2158316.1 oxalate/formate MFS antiporter [Burkholderiales bacterium]MDE2501823.1 oxalate/formate MFS antiporter [Burkholderiales bacterium]
MSTLIDSPVARVDAPALHVGQRWLQLALGVVCMMAISSPQYVWALFTKPLLAQVGGSLATLQVTFSILIVLQTFFSPFQGYLVDRFGPRLLLSAGAVMTGLSWVLSADASTPLQLYLSYGVLGGIGTGVIYVGVVGLMVRWFPRQRGLAVGLVAAGYGFGAIATTFPIASSLASSGFAHTVTVFGFLIGAVGLLAAQGIRRPPVELAQEAVPRGARSASAGPAQMLRTPVFWLMFLMMTMMSTSGLMVISQMGAFAKDFGIASTLVWGMAALPLALTIDRFANGLTRPFFGWLSDRIGRENTMALAFGLEGLAMAAWLALHNDPLLFALLSGVVFFGWGEIFSLFPSTLTDTFGTRHATTNYGILYMAQGIGSILGGPIAAMIHHASGSWAPVFGIMIALDLAAAALALFVLKGMRSRYLAQVAA